jgi:tetratricopeptide (TPR) repeat protein
MNARVGNGAAEIAELRRGTIVGLVRDLHAACTGGLEGAFEILAADVRTTIYVAQGSPKHADESMLAETIGRQLVRQRRLTDDAHAEIVERMNACLLEGRAKRFGEVAIELGLLTPEQVLRAIEDQVRGRVVRALQRPSPEWRFVASRTRDPKAERFRLRLESLVLDAVRRFPEERLHELGGRDTLDARFPRLIAEPSDIAARYTLTDEEQKLVGRLDGRTSVAALQETSAEDADVVAVITSLVMMRDATLLDAPSLALATRPTEIIAARARSSATLATAPALHAIAVAAVARPSIIPASERSARMKAERAFASGKAHLTAGRNEPALVDLTIAYEQQPESREYQLYARWAAMKSATTPSSEASREALKTLAFEATARDPDLAFGPYVLGHLAMDAGKLADARLCFRRALKLEPEFLDAARCLRLLPGRERESGKHAASAARRSVVTAIALPSEPKAVRARPTAPVIPVPAAVLVVPRPLASTPEAAIASPEAPIVAARAPIAAPPKANLAASRSGLSSPIRERRILQVAIAAACMGLTFVCFLPSGRATGTADRHEASAVLASPVAAIAATHTSSALPAAAAATATPRVAGRGVVALPPSAAGHRIFVDGRVVGQGKGDLTVPCGARAIRIGSQGKLQSVRVPCGGRVALDG